MADEPEPEREHDYGLERWLAERFAALGFADDDALTLALAHADYHAAARLLRDGCSLETARAILL